MNLSLFLLAAFIAEIIGTTAGFGSATILTPVAGHFMDFKAAIAVVAFFHLFGNLSRVWLFKGNINWRIFLQFGIPSILFTLGGAFLTAHLNSGTMKWIFGLFLITYVLISIGIPQFGWKATPTTAFMGGISSGFVAGLIGTGGAIRSAFLTAFHLKKEVYVATSAMIALLIDFTRIPIYIMGGALENSAYYFKVIPLLILIAFVGAKIGKYVISRVSQQVFRRFVLSVLFLAGCKLFYDGIWRV